MYTKNTTEAIFNKFREKLCERDYYARKGDYGKLLIAGGSPGMAGAAFLSGLAAFKTGVGMVRYFGPEENRIVLQTLLPEAMYSSGGAFSSGFADAAALKGALSWCTSLIAGPGMSLEKYARDTVKQIFDADLTEKDLVLLDADALNIISEGGFSIRRLSSGRKETNVIVTPHVGEMSRLTGKSISEIKEDPVKAAAEFSEKENCVTVLKDAETYIASPCGEVCGNNYGHPSMAKAGSGDVLTGIIAGAVNVLKEGVYIGACAGDHIHALSGVLCAQKYGSHGVLAGNLAEEAAMIMRK